MHKHRVWKAGRFELDVSASKTLIMGIVNTTPDSFSDGGIFQEPSQAIAHAKQLLDDGANILDVGAESTRPGAQAVDPVSEWARLEPLLTELVTWNVPISVDTMKPLVMRKALALGVDIINDITGFRDPAAVLALQNTRAGGVVMHMQGEPRTMQLQPCYAQVCDEVFNFLSERVQHLVLAGVSADRLLVDQGFGFGKTLKHNVELLHHLTRFTQLGAGVLVGVSRKRMIGELCRQPDALQRVSGSVAAALFAAQQGAAVVRVHDVRATKDAFQVWQALAQVPNH